MKLHVLVHADDFERLVEQLRRNSGVEQLEQIGVPHGSCLRAVVAPALLAQQPLARVVQLGEAWGDAGLDRTFAQQSIYVD